MKCCLPIRDTVWAFLCLLLLPSGLGVAREIGDVAVISDWGLQQFGEIVDTAPSITLVNTSLGVWIDPATLPPAEIGGFDFLLCAETGAMELLYVEPGIDLHTDWEYFTYRKGSAAGGCAEGCDGIQIRLRGVADLDDGSSPDPATFQPSGVIARMVFAVSSDWSHQGQCIPVSFCSASCMDNVLYSRGGDSLFLVNSGITTEPGFTPDACAGILPEKTVIPGLGASTGYVCIRETEMPGDINLNGVRGEVGDLVLFSNYIRFGSTVWTPPYEAIQIISSDMNNDGLPLTPLDLFTLRYIITGSWLQFPLPNSAPW